MIEIKKYINYINESKSYKFKTDISQFDLDTLIEEVVYAHNSSSGQLELLFMLGGKVKENKNLLYQIIWTPDNEKRRLEFSEILIKLGGCDPNKNIYINGIYPSVTCLSMLCDGDKKYKNYNVIAKLIELGGDMSIKDNFNKSAYDYLNTNDIKILSKLVTNFRNNYDLYITSNKYNL